MSNRNSDAHISYEQDELRESAAVAFAPDARFGYADAQAAEDAEDWAAAMESLKEPGTPLAEFAAELKSRGEI